MIRLFIFILANICISSAYGDVETRWNNEDDAAAVDNPKFKITISGDPEYYISKSIYTVTIQSVSDYRFTSFNLTSVLSDVVNTEEQNGPQNAGWFFLKSDDTLATLSSDYLNTVIENDNTPKEKIQVYWTAPAAIDACVAIRATIVVYGNGEVERIQRKLCELDEQPLSAALDTEDQCCACDEASYKVTVQGLWSNATHSKDFPITVWLTHFSDFLAATHNKQLRFWREGGTATEGLRQLAEFGSTSILETELREQKKNLRSVTKINGIWYPRINSNTTTVKLRVDNKHNLFTIASMLGPSPDWFVGISDLNLCDKNCNWIENIVTDLYLYDAGTDSGVSYMSANAPTNPRDKIHQITLEYPEDPRAPFYDSSGAPIKPFAKLYIQRDKIINKVCDDVKTNKEQQGTLAEQNTKDSDKEECRVGNYTEWTQCSASCGNAIRSKHRNYTFPEKAKKHNCNRQLVIKEICTNLPPCPDDSEENLDIPDEFCKTTNWTAWSDCTVICGIGFMTRSRRFLSPSGIKRCRHIDVLEKKKCMEPPCQQITSTVEETACKTTEWSDWSPCTSLCGPGTRIRIRQLLDNENGQGHCLKNTVLEETRECFGESGCHGNDQNAKETCKLPSDVGPCRGNYKRWYYNAETKECLPFTYGGCRGNKNNFLSVKECRKLCMAQ